MTRDKIFSTYVLSFSSQFMGVGVTKRWNYVLQSIWVLFIRRTYNIIYNHSLLLFLFYLFSPIFIVLLDVKIYLTGLFRNDSFKVISFRDFFYSLTRDSYRPLFLKSDPLLLTGLYPLTDCVNPLLFLVLFLIVISSWSLSSDKYER